MENNKNSNKNNIIPIIIVICISIVASLSLGVFLGININTTNEAREEEKNTEIKELVIEIESKKAKQIIEDLNKIYISEKDLYNDNNYDVSQMSDHDLVVTAVNFSEKEMVSACVFDKERPKLTFDYLNSLISNYLENKKITADTIKALDEESMAEYDYHINDLTTTPSHFGIKLNSDNIQLYGPCGGELHLKDEILKKVVKITETDKYINIYEKQAFGTSANPDNIDVDRNYNYYNNYEKTGDIVETTTTEPNWELYKTTYKYTLKKHNSGYYFEKVELEK